MTPDPRTEEIRTNLCGTSDCSICETNRYLLGRIEALEGGREVEQTMLRNAVPRMVALEAERDRYRAVADAAREIEPYIGDVSGAPKDLMDDLAAALAALDGQS